MSRPATVVPSASSSSSSSTGTSRTVVSRQGPAAVSRATATGTPASGTAGSSVSSSVSSSSRCTSSSPHVTLLHLPSVVLGSLAPLLTVHEKLTVFNRLHRSLPRLTPASFQHDQLSFHQRRHCIPAHLLPLLSAVSSLHYGSGGTRHGHTVPGGEQQFATFCDSLAPPSHDSPTPFSNLRHLTLHLPEGRRETEPMNHRRLARTLRTPNALPLLTSIHITGRYCLDRHIGGALLFLPSLTKVVLSRWSMGVADLLALLRVPSLAHLEVTGKLEHTTTQDASDCGCGHELTVSASCHTLLLPLREVGVYGVRGLHCAVLPLLYEQLALDSDHGAPDQRGPDGRQPPDLCDEKDEKKEASRALTAPQVQRLAVLRRGRLVAKVITTPLTSVAFIRSLRILTLSSNYEVHDLDGFAAAASPSTLPHLQTLRYAGGQHVPSLRGVDAAYHVVHCIRAFALQLRELQFEVLNQEVAAAVFNAALQCSQLRVLQVYSATLDLTLYPVDTCRSLSGDRLPPSLHTLVLHHFSIDNGQLTNLLLRSSTLEDVHLQTPILSPNVMCALAHHPRLRRLCLESDGLQNRRELPLVRGALRRLVASTSKGQKAFSSLRFLRVHLTSLFRQFAYIPRDCAVVRRRHTMELLSLIPVVIRHAPLVHLHLASPYMDSGLHLFSSFTQLRVLCVQRSAHVQAVAAPFRPTVPPTFADRIRQELYPIRRLMLGEAADEDGAIGNEIMAGRELEYDVSRRDMTVLFFDDTEAAATFFALVKEATGVATTFSPQPGKKRERGGEADEGQQRTKNRQ